MNFLKLFYIKKKHFIVLLLVSILFFLGNGQFDLLDNSETHYTRVTQEMAQTGDLLNLSYNGKPWYVHPPLYFWMTTLSTHVFGWSETVLRFQSALFSSFNVCLTYLIGSLFFGPIVALVAAILFGTSLYSVCLGKLAIFDAHLYCFMLLSLYLILQFIHHKAAKPWWMLCAGLITGIGILTKGPISLVQQLLFLCPYLLLIKQTSHFKSKWIWLGIIISIALPAPWYAHQLMHHGKPFFDLALRDYTWFRFFGVVESQGGPWYYYFTVLLAFFPWICWLPSLIIDHIKHKPFQKESLPAKGHIFSWCCIISTFCFFSLAQTKLPNYIYLIFPFLSLLIAEWLVRKKHYRNILWPLLIYCVIVIIAGYTITIYSIDATSQLLLKMTFMIISLPIFAFFIGTIQKKSITWILVVYTLLNFSSLYWLSYIILPRVSHFDDVKKAAVVVLEDSNGMPYEMIHYHGIQPSLLVRLNKNVAQLRSVSDVETIINTSSIVYILAHKKYQDELLELSQPVFQEWQVGESFILKFQP